MCVCEQVTWFKGDKEIAASSGGDRRSEYNAEYTAGIVYLEIFPCGLAHAGRYTCRAENSKGADETHCNVNIEGAAIFLVQQQRRT